MSQIFNVIVIDPPYSFSDKLGMSAVKRGASANYNTMSVEEIKALPIQQIAAPDGCLLALWCPSSLLVEGLEIMKNWGFSFKQTYIWVKSKQEPFKKLLTKAAKSILLEEEISKANIKNIFKEVQNVCSSHLDEVLQFGLGRLFRQTHEVCLIGINNSGVYNKLDNRSQRSVSFSSNTKHSRKPEALQDSLEIMFPGASFCEIFARRPRPGWVCLGNEVSETYGEGIRVSLDKLINIKKCQ